MTDTTDASSSEGVWLSPASFGNEGEGLNVLVYSTTHPWSRKSRSSSVLWLASEELWGVDYEMRIVDIRAEGGVPEGLPRGSRAATTRYPPPSRDSTGR